MSKLQGGGLPGPAANRQVCPTISEMTLGNHSSGLKFLIRTHPRFEPSSGLLGSGARSGSTKRALASADISRSRE